MGGESENFCIASSQSLTMTMCAPSRHVSALGRLFYEDNS